MSLKNRMKKRNSIVALTLLVIMLAGIFMIKKNQTPSTPPTIVNPGFEDTDPLKGWITSGVAETDGYEGGMRLTHPGGSTPVESIQQLSDLSNGWYTLKAWVRSSGKQKEAYIVLKGCGGDEARTSVPIVRKDKWLQIVASAKVTRHKCTISLYSDAAQDEWVSFDNVEMVPGRAAVTVMGADISSLKKSEDKGGV
jgi:arabinogalactan endo-1,4-beta-galactosidase